MRRKRRYLVIQVQSLTHGSNIAAVWQAFNHCTWEAPAEAEGAPPAGTEGCRWRPGAAAAVGATADPCLFRTNLRRACLPCCSSASDTLRAGGAARRGFFAGAGAACSDRSWSRSVLSCSAAGGALPEGRPPLPPGPRLACMDLPKLEWLQGRRPNARKRPGAHTQPLTLTGHLPLPPTPAGEDMELISLALTSQCGSRIATPRRSHP